MRDRDRWWWAEFIFGLAFCACGVAAPFVGMRTIPTDDPYMTSTEYWQLIGMVAFIMLISLGGGVTILIMALRGRSRHRTRVAALQVDVDVMPLAEIRTEPGMAPDVAGQPFELMWRGSKATNILYIPLLGVEALAALASVGISLFALVAPIFLPAQPSPEDLLNGTPPHAVGITEIILRVAGAGVVLALVIALGILLVRATPFLFGRPFGLSVTNQGIDARTELGSRIHMAWDEMRLLEVAKGDAHATRRFYVYAAGKRVGWTVYTTGLGAQYVPANVTASEMALRQVALLNLIAARTGLAPRTLAKGLAKQVAGSPAPAGTMMTQGSILVPAREGKRSSNTVILLVLALILVAAAAAVLFLPATSVLWMNWLSAGSEALAALLLIVVAMLMAFARDTLPASAQPPSVGAPTLAAPGVVYALGWRTPLRRRLALMGIGLCLAVNLIPAVWMLLPLFASSLPGVHPQFLDESVFTIMGRIVLAIVLAMFAVVGLGFALGGIIAGTIRIRADKNGLTTGSGRLQRFIAWSSVQDISGGAGSRGQFSYLVKTDVPTIQASWPAEVAYANPPSDGAIPIGTDELAVLVAAQIGKTIRVRQEG